MSSLNYIPLILFAVLLNTGAQIALKVGMRTIGYFDFTLNNFIPISIKLIKNPYIMGGMFLYVFSLTAWLLTLSRVEVSYAYPLSSIGYILTALVGYYLLQENLSMVRVSGIAIIMIGVYLVAKSS